VNGRVWHTFGNRIKSDGIESTHSFTFSTHEVFPHEALQIDTLKEVSCEKWFVDKITGSKAERKGLNEALAYLRPGDTFVEWKLDRVGRLLKQLMGLLKDLQERGIEFVSLDLLTR
jgi:DNA invertase Pin-like site-specific DNA recombinase